MFKRLLSEDILGTGYNMTDKDLKRFLKYVIIGDKDDCWEWQGTIDKRGYGIYSVRQKLFKAHRISFAIYNGFLDSKLHICHKCDNPKCVNPFHLWQGTHQDNMKDRDSKGRNITGHVYGEANKGSKLTVEGVRFIRANYDGKTWTIPKLAKQFGVCNSKIGQVLRNESWRDV